MKFHGDGQVLDEDTSELETFHTDLDLFAGNSGAPILDSGGVVVGIASAGGEDFGTVTGADCQMGVVGDSRHASERATYAFRALEALCRATPDSGLCATAVSGCGFAGPVLNGGAWPQLWIALTSGWWLAHRRRSAKKR